MPAEFTLQVVTPAEMVFEGCIHSLIVPAATGYLGVWAHHAPLLAILGQGRMTVLSQDGEQAYDVSGGFLEVRDNRATVMVDELVSAA